LIHRPGQKVIVFYLIALVVPIAVMASVLVSNSSGVLAELFAYLERTGQYANTLSILRFSLSESPWGVAILVFAAAPTMAALLTASFAGKEQLHKLLRRLKPLGPDQPAPAAKNTYLWLFAIYLSVLGGYVAVSAFAGTDDSYARTIANLQGPGLGLILWIIIAPFLDEGGLLEEPGWRGFATPLLQQIFQTPLKAALLLGALWWAWHLPREIPTILGGQDLGRWASLQALFLALCLAETIVCVLCVNLCGGSVLPAILIHGGSNVWSKAAAADMYAVTDTDVRTAIMIIAALWTLARFGRQLGRTGP